MARLLDLSDELLLMIVSNLQWDYVTSPKFPLDLLVADYVTGVIKALEQTRQLHALALSCRRLNNIVTPFLYRNFAVDNCWESPCPEQTRVEKLNRTLKDHRGLGRFLVSAVVPCGESIMEVFPLFWLPNIRSLIIWHFNDWEAPRIQGLLA